MNKVVKSTYLILKIFTVVYSDELTKLFLEDDDELVDLSTG